KRKFSPFSKSRSAKRFSKRVQTAKPMQRVKSLECEINGTRCERDKTEVQAESLYKEDVSGGVWCSTNDNKRCHIKTLEACEITGFKHDDLPIMYDLCVEDNHNYTVTENNYLVHNSGKSFLGASLIFGEALM